MISFEMVGKYVTFNCVFLLIFLVIIKGCFSTDVRSCSELIKSVEEDSTDDASEFQLINPLPKQGNGTIEIYFSEPVDSIQSSQAVSESSLPTHWILTVHPNGTKTDMANWSEIFFKANYSKKADVLKIVVDMVEVCAQQERDRNLPVGCPKDFKKPTDKIIEKKAVWASGRNYRVSIPAVGNFTGYAVEIFFTKPVDKIVTKPELYHVMVNSTHWIITKESTEPACIKLVDFHLELEFAEESDIEVLILNGKSIIGEGKSEVVYRSQNYEVAKEKNCDRYFLPRGNPWFGKEIAMPLWFEAKLDVNEVGVVVDLIFEREVKEVRVWRLLSTKISGSIWRMENPGWLVTPNESVFFDFAIYYFEDYYVKVKGIMVNGRILCGLGIDLFYTKLDKPAPQDFQNTPLEKSFSDKDTYLIIVSIILTSVIIIFTGIVFPLLLIKKVNKALNVTENYFNMQYSVGGLEIYSEIQPSNTNSSDM